MSGLAVFALDQDHYRMHQKIFVALHEFYEPKFLKDARSFQAMASQLASFNEELAAVMRPFRDLSKKSDEPFYIQ